MTQDEIIRMATAAGFNVTSERATRCFCGFAALVAAHERENSAKMQGDCTLAEPKCNPHPDAPHGFARNASHNAGRYVCECEGWEPDQAEQEPVAQVVKSCKTFNVYEAIVDTGNKLLAADTKLYAAPVSIDAAVLAEREACAKLLGEMAARDNVTNYYKVAANAIRARGGKWD